MDSVIDEEWRNGSGAHRLQDGQVVERFAELQRGCPELFDDLAVRSDELFPFPLRRGKLVQLLDSGFGLALHHNVVDDRFTIPPARHRPFSSISFCAASSSASTSSAGIPSCPLLYMAPEVPRP